MQRPLARANELVVEDAGDEVLVYDERTAAAHCLSGPAAVVWRACDGHATIDEIAAMLEIDDETVRRAIDQLEQCELLEVPQPAGITRRDATQRLAKVGAAAAVAPLIYSIAAPTPALAASQAACLGLGCGQDCGASGCGGIGCACCCTGSGNFKYCSADCSAANCSEALQMSHCPGATKCNGTCTGP